MPSDAQDLQVLLEEQERRNRFSPEISEVVKEMKNSLISQGQSQWEELLQVAPIAMSCIGACYVAASSPETEVELQQPDNGFKHLEYVEDTGHLSSFGVDANKRCVMKSGLAPREPC